MTTYRIARFFRARRIGCIVPSHATIGKGTKIEHRGIAVVINRKAVIGERCSIGAQVVIGGKGKENPRVPSIDGDTYLGAGAKILAAARIGDRCHIGAHSVFIQDFPSGATAVGIRARPIEIFE